MYVKQQLLLRWYTQTTKLDAW